MKKITYSFIAAMLLFSCEQYPESGSETIESFSFGVIGNNQSTTGAGYLSQEVGAQINLQSLIPITPKQFHLEIEVTSGNGNVDETIIKADSEGKMLTNWKLGDNRNKQILSCQIIDSEDEFYSEFTIEATVIFEDRLNEISNGYLVGIQDMVRDTINQLSMMVSGSTVYVSNSNKLFDWHAIYSQNLPNIKELEINSEGHVFAAGWNGELYQTRNWGITWDNLGKPIPDNRYHFELSISKDDLIWANKWEQGMYCSKDNGLTWTKDTIGLTEQEEMGPVFSFADSSHMSISYANLTIHKTSDNGQTWHTINTPEYSISLFITDDNAIIAQNQNGFNLHKSIDGGKTYKSVFRASVAYGTTSKHCYDKFKNYYYILAPGGGIWKTKDFEVFDELMRFGTQRNLFIDHNGTVYASGFKYSNDTPDPTYVIPFSE